MTQVINPLDHFSTRYLKRQLRKTYRKLNRIASGRSRTGDFEQLRALLLSMSESLSRRKDVEDLERLMSASTPEERELDYIPS
jgi:hypothetical protein